MVDHFCPWHYEKSFPKHVDSLKYKKSNKIVTRVDV